MAKRAGFTLLEAVLAAAILAIGVIALIGTISRALLLSETNKQLKMALFDVQSICEEIQGAPFDQIMDPDYPTPEQPEPRFRHRQPVPGVRLYGFLPAYASQSPIYERLTDTYVSSATGALIAERDNSTGEYVDPATGQAVANASHLDDQVITVTYGSALDTADADGDGDVTEALPLPLEAGAESSSVFTPTTSAPVERFRPAKNSETLEEFRTPEPLYVTVEATWQGSRDQTMRCQVTFVRSR